ncbi:MAG: S8 family peptidase [Chloroflexi bacterium]|nr:S8 family peptidase [Chloroflexota bacterium]
MKVSKLSPRLAVELDIVDAHEEIPVIVELKQGGVAKGLGLPIHMSFRLTPTVALTALRDEIFRLTTSPQVSRIWRDVPVHACLDVSVPLTEAPSVWREGFLGSGITVAIVDTGVDAQHPALVGRVVARYDLTGEGEEDKNGHGTHVAGIIAGTGDKYKGMAPQARLVSVKVLRRDGSGMMTGVMLGVERAAEERVHVINLSLGASGASDGTDPLSRTCDAAVARGVAVCVAAGNDGPARGTVGSPGAARRVIAIGASTDGDAVADFSSRGPTADGRVKPDLLFPGYGIISARAQGTAMGRTIDDLYTEASGTSMATPHASGAVALLLEARPGLNPAQVKDLLISSAKDLGLSPSDQGAGRAQVYHAYGSPLRPTPAPEPAPLPERPGCLPGLVRQVMGVGG